MKNRGHEADIEVMRNLETEQQTKIKELEKEISKLKLKSDLYTKEKNTRKEMLNIKIDQLSDSMIKLDECIVQLHE